jgi:hypothetical protein
MYKKDLLDFYNASKVDHKARTRRIMYTRMFLEANSGLFPEGWTLTLWAPGYITVAAPESVALPEFIKVADRIAKKLNCEPKKQISEERVAFNYSVWFGEYRKTWKKSRCLQSVNLELTTKNTEGCEVTYKRKMQKVPVLTGYCKEIYEQKHL